MGRKSLTFSKASLTFPKVIHHYPVVLLNIPSWLFKGRLNANLYQFVQRFYLKEYVFILFCHCFTPVKRNTKFAEKCNTNCEKAHNLR